MTEAERRKLIQRRKKRRRIQRRIVLGVAVAAVLGVGIFSLRRTVQTVQMVREVNIVIDGENVSRLSSEEAIALLEQKYPWNLTVVYGENSYQIENMLAPQIQSVVQQAYREADQARVREDVVSLWDKLFQKQEDNETVVVNHELAMPDGAAVASELAGRLSREWGIPVQNASITGYDATTGTFTVTEGKSGTEIDEEKLRDEIVDAIDRRDFEGTIQAPEKVVEPDVSVSDYKVMATYETTTTANQDRNTNVRLAAGAVSGTILEPGEQFSFNTVVGPRTAEKGYKQAAAYSDGQTVLEYGGGVCQVSSTLYNCVIGAGLRTDVRTGHTFEPSYVTPGQDATVSYAEPDFVFTNTSNATVGIKAVYSDRKMYVELFGVPVLEEGVKRYMKSEKTADLDPPAPTYVESADIAFGTEVVQKGGSNGSIWITNIVTEKDGVVIDEEYLHQTRYKGHNATILRNTQYPDGGQPAGEQPADAGYVAPPQPAPEPQPQPATELQPEPVAEQPAPPEAEQNPTTEASD